MDLEAARGDFCDSFCQTIRNEDAGPTRVAAIRKALDDNWTSIAEDYQEREKKILAYVRAADYQKVKITYDKQFPREMIKKTIEQLETFLVGWGVASATRAQSGSASTLFGDKAAIV